MAAFQRAIVDDPPAIFLAWSERARAVSTRFDVPARAGPRYAGARCASGSRSTERDRAEPQLKRSHAVRHPSHRDTLRPASWPSRPSCRCSPTASSRSSRCSAARANRSSPATRTSPPAPPKKSAATSSANADILKALAADLQNTGLEPWQQDRILKNYVLQFREFREITLFDEAGGVVATSRVGQPRVTIPTGTTLTVNGASMSPIRVDDDLLPTAVFAIHLTQLNQPAGWLVGEFSLEEMWRMVDGIRIGEHGFALVVAPDGALIAHGDPDKKALVAQARNMTGHPLVGRGEQRRPPGSNSRRPTRAEQPGGRGARSRRSAGRSSSSSRPARPTPTPTALQRQLDGRDRRRRCSS